MSVSSGLAAPDYYSPCYTNAIFSSQPVEVPLGITVNGVLLSTASDTATGGNLSSPTVTATAGNNVTSVKLANVRLVINGTDATLDGQAVVQGTVANVAATAFSLQLPQRTTAFSDVLSVRGYVGGKDANLNGVNNGVVSSVKNDTKANIAFTMGGVNVLYYVDFNVKYQVA